MAPTSKSLRVTITDGRGNTARAPGLAGWLQRIAPSRARGDVAIALVSDARIRSLNRRFRRVDKPTDVLAFPVHSGPLPPGGGSHTTKSVAFAFRRKRDPRPSTPELGDIVISLDTARRQARAAGHSLSAELKVLGLHGLLHLLGYDHHQQTDRVRMRRAEARLRVAGGLRAGLIERAGS
jgi:probable rRNA maturation factor